MIDELIIALENLQEAKAEYREAAKTYQYERDYFLRREEKAIDDAKKEFERIFKSAVSAIVVDVINNNPHR